MSFWWVIAGSIAQLQLGVFLFYMVVKSASGIGDRHGPARVHQAILKGCVIGLPASALLSAAVVIFLYLAGASAQSYWWYALPFAATVLYSVYASSLAVRVNGAAEAAWVVRRR